LHTAKVITEAQETEHHGVSFSTPKIDLEQLRNWKANDVVGKLTGGLAAMAKQRGVMVVQGLGKFTSPNQIAFTSTDGKVTKVGFESAIIAAGSQATKFSLAPRGRKNYAFRFWSIGSSRYSQTYARDWWRDYWSRNGNGI
jgi:dihydrolipoamide dehydrogenase